jgi:predicted RNA-binding Zn-ribbon protein involved in translation (DUF1610 family)
VTRRYKGFSPGAKSKTHVWVDCPRCGGLLRSTLARQRFNPKVCFRCRHAPRI